MSIGYDLKLKRGDTRPQVLGIAKDKRGNPVDLTGAAGYFYMRNTSPDTGELIVNAGVCVIDPDQVNNMGYWYYAWVPGDTDHIGVNYGEFKADWGGGDIQTFPQEGFVTIYISEDVA